MGSAARLGRGGAGDAQRAQRVEEGLHPVEARGASALEGAVDHGGELRGDGGRDRHQGGGVPVDHLQQVLAPQREGEAARERFEEDRADGPDVRARVEVEGAEHLLRGHVPGGPDDRAGERGAGRLARLRDLRDAEIDELRRDAAARVLRDEDVLGLHVAVHDAAGVRRDERLHHRAHAPQRLVRGERFARVEGRAQVAPHQELLHDEERAGPRVAPHVEHVDDVGVRDPRRHLGLPLEPLHDLRVDDRRGLEHLQRDAPREEEVLGFEDRAAAALADLAHHPVLVVDRVAGLDSLLSSLAHRASSLIARASTSSGASSVGT